MIARHRQNAASLYSGNAIEIKEASEGACAALLDPAANPQADDLHAARHPCGTTTDAAEAHADDAAASERRLEEYPLRVAQAPRERGTAAADARQAPLEAEKS